MAMVEVDLHLHTTCSDGRLTPAALVRLCAERGLKVISITDHDSTDGLPEAISAAEQYPQLTIIPGIELGSDHPGSEVHILGYYVDRFSSQFQHTIRKFREGRRERARVMVEKLSEFGVTVSWERVVELSGDGAIGRPHIAQAMVEAGYVTYPKEAFDKYLGKAGLAYAERPNLSPAEAVRLLVSNGALPVMAHPTYAVPEGAENAVASLRETLTSLKSAGLVGVEVYYKDYTPAQVEQLLALAQELGLVPCGGSDYHSSGNPDEPEPGAVGPPMSTVEALAGLMRSAGADEGSRQL